METKLHGQALILAARAFAESAHSRQVRKYTGEPYFAHCEEVAALLEMHGERPEVVAAGYNHDTIEDCGVTRDQLAEALGEDVARLVVEVTDVSRPGDGNRRARKAIDLKHLSKASRDGKTVKLADICSNAPSIFRHDADFAKVYFREMQELLPHLRGGNPVLFAKAQELLG